MKLLTWLVAAALSFLISQAGDPDPQPTSVSGVRNNDKVADDKSGEGQDDDESSDKEDGEAESDEEGGIEDAEASEDELDEDDEDEEEDEDERFFQRKRIAQAFDFCLKKADLTPVELANCVADIVLGGTAIGNPTFAKCLGEYVTCTGVVCSAVIVQNKEGGLNQTKVFKCLGSCVPNLVRCIARSTPLPQKID